MSTCILVLGTPRSGTSCLAGILSKLGIYIGDNLLRANDMNEMGFFQDIEFEELFDNCPEWMPQYPGKDLCDKEKLHSLIQKRCKEHEIWGLKIRLGAFVVEDFEMFCDIKLIVLDRNKQQSIDSLTKWSLPSDQNPTEVIERSRDAIQNVLKTRKALHITFDSLLNSAESKVEHIAEYIGKEKTNEAVEFINPSLRRY